jgi:hypothetical protein
MNGAMTAQWYITLLNFEEGGRGSSADAGRGLNISSKK